MRREITALMTIALVAGNAAAAAAGFPKTPITTCAPDAVVSGTVCMDKYEDSVWRIPDPKGTGKALVTKVQKGSATEADLTAAGATRLGVSTDDYAPCDHLGNACGDIFAVSLGGVTPSGNITWFQSLQACKNSGKRLPSNAEWQAAVTGTPNPGPDDGVADCNTADFTAAITATGSRSNCVSDDGAFDLVGNLNEWVADWVPRSTGCASWTATEDSQCLAGADTAGEPGALIRGGQSKQFTAAGPLLVDGRNSPATVFNRYGFRCDR